MSWIWSMSWSNEISFSSLGSLGLFSGGSASGGSWGSEEVLQANIVGTALLESLGLSRRAWRTAPVLGSVYCVDVITNLSSKCAAHTYNKESMTVSCDCCYVVAKAAVEFGEECEIIL